MTSDDQGLVPLLSPGRRLLTVNELHAIAVAAFPESRVRPVLWATFERTRCALAPLVRELWIGGSFVSSKQEPADIDLLAVLRLDRIQPPRDQRLDEFLTNAAYNLGLPLGVDLTLIFEGDEKRGARWCEWIEWGKPYLRTDSTSNRGVAVISLADGGRL